MTTPDVFAALANPVRRRILEQLREGPVRVTDLASGLPVGRPAVSEHLQVLRQARLVREEPRGRERWYHLAPAPLAEVDGWIGPYRRFWTERLAGLATFLDQEDEMSEPRGTIRVEHRFPQPPERVWRAITDAEQVARWWARGDVRPVVGHRFTLDLGPWGEQRCEVLLVEPPRLFRYRFSEGSLDTVLTFELHPDGAGTRLVLTHEGFDLDSPMGRAAHEGMGRGWPGVVARIATVF